MRDPRSLSSSQSICGDKGRGGVWPSGSATDLPRSICGLPVRRGCIQDLFLKPVCSPVCKGASPLLLPGLPLAFPGQLPRASGPGATGDTGFLHVSGGDPQHSLSCCPVVLPRGCWTRAAHRCPSARAGRSPSMAQLSMSPAGLHRSLQKLLAAGISGRLQPWPGASLGGPDDPTAQHPSSFSLSFHQTAKHPKKTCAAQQCPGASWNSEASRTRHQQPALF